MGKSAIRSHESRPKHIKNVKPSKQSNIDNFFHMKTSNSETPISNFELTSAAPSLRESSVSMTAPSSSTSLSTPSTSLSTPSTSRSTLATKHVIKYETTRAEIIWALDCIKKHRSYHSSNDQGEIFRAMFPDSSIAENYQMAEDKLSYVTVFGLAPHFQQETLTRIRSAPEFSISFDEAHNTVIEKGQLDLWVRYFDDTTGRVISEYVVSVFLGHARAQDLLESVAKAFTTGQGLEMQKLIQIRMDGPNVNLSFYHHFLEDFEGKFDKSLLQTGICSLHVVSGALQQGHRNTDWNLNGILQGMFRVWKDSPARRADYISLTGSNIFPKHFCKIRWLENKTCCEHAIAVFPNVKKYCEQVKPKPVIQSFTTVEKATRDHWCPAKLHFFKTVAEDLEPFMRRFQSDKPMLPFLHDFLLNLTQDCLKRFMTPTALHECGSDFSKMKKETKITANQKDSVSTDVGFGAKRAIPSTATPREKLEFYGACKQFLIGVTDKLFERSPLNYGLVRGASALLPTTIVHKSQNVCVKRFDTLLEKFLDAKQISTSDADSAKREYFHFLNDPSIHKKLKEFDLDEERLDDLYVELVKSNEAYQHLWMVIRKILILFHGQSMVEGGFSINKDILVENLVEKSVVAQRIVFNAIQYYKGVLQVPITEKLIQSVRSSSNRRKFAISEAREKAAAEEALKKKAEALNKELKSIQRQKAKLAEEALDLDDRALAIKRMKSSIN